MVQVGINSAATPAPTSIPTAKTNTAVMALTSRRRLCLLDMASSLIVIPSADCRFIAPHRDAMYDANHIRRPSAGEPAPPRPRREVGKALRQGDQFGCCAVRARLCVRQLVLKTRNIALQRLDMCA